MLAPRVYADFNAIEYVSRNPHMAEIPLTGYGTLASLSMLKLRLEEGMVLLVYEPEDIECEATAHFDLTRTDPTGRKGEWVARIDPRNVRDSTHIATPLNSHPCFTCGNDLAAHFALVGRSYTEVCPICGTSVMAPLAPPPSAT